MLTKCHLSQLIFRQAEKYGERPALSFRDDALGRWLPISWKEFAARVRQVSLALLQLGVGVQERVAVFSQNKPEVFFANFGIYGIRGISVPFYATSSGAEVAYMLNDAEVRVLFVGEQEQYDVAFGLLSVARSLEKIIIFDPGVRRRSDDHISEYFSEWLSESLKGDLSALEGAYALRLGEACDDDLIDILYTSGTTGQSKGVMLSYGQFQAAIEANDAVLPIREGDVSLNFLPLTHVFERGWAYLGLSEGALQCVNLRPSEILASMQEVHPTCMSSVPRFWEKVYQAVLEKREKGSFLERKLISEALEVGERYYVQYQSKGRPAPLPLTLRYKLYDRTIIKVLRKTLGLERPNIFPTAGATVSPEVEKFVHAAGINMVVGYGLTESMATVSCNRQGEPCTPGSVGRVLPSVELKFGENDEILLRGKTITKGYFHRESQTRAAIDSQGWFHTGDAGYLKNGELYLRERIKDLFKTSNGKYVAPQLLESKLVVDRFFNQVVIVAEKRKFVSALITPDYDALEALAAGWGLEFSDREALCQDERILAFCKERMDTLQQDLSPFERIKRFYLLPCPLSMERGELTNTLKVRRQVVYEHYAREIEGLYAEASAPPSRQV